MGVRSICANLHDWLSFATFTMNPTRAVNSRPKGAQAFDETIWEDSQALGSQLQVLRERLFPPEAKKELRSFSTAETAKLIGVTESYIRNLATDEAGPIPEKAHTGRRRYTLEQVHALRQHLTKGKTSYVPWRKDRKSTRLNSSHNGQIHKSRMPSWG